MVLESLVNPVVAERKPWMMILLGFLYATVGVFLSYWVFQSYSSLVMIFLTVLACAPLMYRTIKMEEKKDILMDGEGNMLREHWKALSFLLFLFLGITAAYALWYTVLPPGMSSTLFSVQQETINRINPTGQVTGNYIVEGIDTFTKIFFNNLNVLLFCLIFSLLYGLGAIFILVWNASVIGVAFGNFIRDKLSVAAAALGLAQVGLYLHVTSWGFVRYAIHGIPEILAYFIGGLAGGILSIAIVKHDYVSKKFEKVIMDSADLVIIAIITLIFAAAIETYITPALYLH
ncbi:stage II sporulation protein M [Candidatus Woesearchaeota archaeon]|nr:stage II sporulation protein M [Candidatus Woesearchaeota archaeon]